MQLGRDLLAEDKEKLRKELQEEVILKQPLTEDMKLMIHITGERGSPAEGVTGVKALRWEWAWLI